MAFEPATAAIVGASSDPKKFGGRALKFCLKRGFRGVLYPVNANADEVQGVRAYRNITDLPQAPDIAVIAVPTPQVLESLVAASEHGAGIAIVYDAKFAECGVAGRARPQELVAVARRHGMRLIGPNCSGSLGAWEISVGAAMATDKLTDIAVRKAKSRDKLYKLSDGGGVYLEVRPNGAGYWRLKYRIGGFEKRLSLGAIPGPCPDLIVSYTQIGANHLDKKSGENETKNI